MANTILGKYKTIKTKIYVTYSLLIDTMFIKIIFHLKQYKLHLIQIIFKTFIYICIINKGSKKLKRR